MHAQTLQTTIHRAGRIAGTVLITGGVVLVLAALAISFDLFGLQLHVQNLLLENLFDSVQAVPAELRNAVLSNLVLSMCPLVALIGVGFVLMGLTLRI